MTQPDDRDAAARVGEEMAKIPYEPLLPVEKQLIVGSLVLGVVLLGVLLWVSYTFFPGTT
jgi:hypothetical protein